MKDLITIIVPIYNVEKYLKQCLESIINQTYKNLEIILVDDGSPDNCGTICDEYAKEDNRIKVIHKENGGLSSARNAGLDVSKGEYISFIDSDDYIALNYIETLYNLCVDKKCDIAVCDFLKFKLEPDIIDREKIVNCYSNISYLEKNYEINGDRVTIVCNKLYKNYLYQNVRFPIGKTNEDEFVTYKVLFNCETEIVETNEQMYYYRFNPESIMGRKFNLKRLDYIQALDERKTFFGDEKKEKLYINTVIEYQKIMRHFYVCIRDNLNKSKKYEKLVVDKARENYKEYKRYDIVEGKDKIVNGLFCFCPKLYYMLLKTKKILIKNK